MRSTTRWVLAVCVLATLCRPALAQPDYKTWYLAEGSTGFFEEEILIANPNNSPASVTITYLLPAGSVQPPVKQVQIAAMSRVTVRVNDDIIAPAVSAVVTSTVPVVVERSMYWGGAARLAGHNSTAVSAPKTEWYLAEGAIGFFDTYILIANPNTTGTDVELTFFGPNGATKTATFNVAAQTRRNVSALVDGGVEFTAFSTRVRSLDPSVPVLVERAMYWNSFTAGTNETALSSLSPTWRFGEGFTAAGFQTYLLLTNPNADAVNVKTTFFLEDGSTRVDNRQVPGQSRENVYANSLPDLSNSSFSILVESLEGREIAAERAMYWNGFREGHTVAGIRDEAAKWGFAEGLEDRFNNLDYDTYFLLNNSRDDAVTVKATFLLEDGTGLQDTFVINGRSRKTLIAGAYTQLSNMRFAAFFEASGPIVAERSVYWGNPWYGGHASAGVPWPFDVPTPTAAPAGPVVTSISPAAGSTNGGTDVTIVGRNFRQDTRVTIGGVAVPYIRVADARTIVVTTPRHSAGAKDLVVTSLGQTAANWPAFLYEAAIPPGPPRTPDPPAGQMLPLPNMEWVVTEVARAVPGSAPQLLPGRGRNLGVHGPRRRPTPADRRSLGLQLQVRQLPGHHRRTSWPITPGPVRTSTALSQTCTVDIIGGHCGRNPSAWWAPHAYSAGPGAARWHNRFRF